MRARRNSQKPLPMPSYGLEMWVRPADIEGLNLIEVVFEMSARVGYVDVKDWKGADELVIESATRILEEDGELPSMAELAHILAHEGIEDKLEWLAEMLMGDYETQVVLFAAYLESMDAIEEWLKTIGDYDC